MYVIYSWPLQSPVYNVNWMQPARPELTADIQSGTKLSQPGQNSNQSAKTELNPANQPSRSELSPASQTRTQLSQQDQNIAQPARPELKPISQVRIQPSQPGQNSNQSASWYGLRVWVDHELYLNSSPAHFRKTIAIICHNQSLYYSCTSWPLNWGQVS